MPIDHLILIPTAFESRLASARLADVLRRDDVAQFHCGFGPIAAAAVTAELISIHQPKQVSLVGIAGAYRAIEAENQIGDRESRTPSADHQGLHTPLEIGQAYSFSSVTIDGVGVGSGDEFQSAGDLEWQQFSGDHRRPAIGDEIKIDPHPKNRSPPPSPNRLSHQLPDQVPHRLLTVCAASSSPAQADRRRQRYRSAAEDMEGFSVAMACRLQNTPLQIFRGISNVAGDRDKSNWKIADAINAAVELLQTTLEQLP